MGQLIDWISANSWNQEAITSVITIVFSLIIAYTFGDVAGAKAAIKFEKRREYEAQQIALYALLNQVKVAKELAVHNSLLEYPNERRAQPTVRMPVLAFETALLTGKDSFLAKQLLDTQANGSSPTPLEAISKYLVDAYTINTLVDLYQSLIQAFDASHQAARDDALLRLRERSRIVIESLNETESFLTQTLNTLLKERVA